MASPKMTPHRRSRPRDEPTFNGSCVVDPATVGSTGARSQQAELPKPDRWAAVIRRSPSSSLPHRFGSADASTWPRRRPVVTKQGVVHSPSSLPTQHASATDAGCVGHGVCKGTPCWALPVNSTIMAPQVAQEPGHHAPTDARNAEQKELGATRATHQTMTLSRSGGKEKPNGGWSGNRRTDKLASCFEPPIPCQEHRESPTGPAWWPRSPTRNSIGYRRKDIPRNVRSTKSGRVAEVERSQPSGYPQDRGNLPTQRGGSPSR